MKIKESNLSVLLIFILLAVVMRFFSFFPSVINHDESTYIVIADALRAGKMYWVDIIDTKPIGIFLLFGMFQSLFGEPIAIIRIMGALWVAFTAFGLYKVMQLLGGKGNAPLASGMIYIFIISIFTFFGVSPNTELFFNLFTITAFWIILSKNRWWYYFIGGLLLGIGFMIKYVVLFDSIGIALYLAWLAYRNQFKLGQLFMIYVLMGIGFCIPFGLTFLYYFNAGHLDEFLFFTFELSSRYFVDPHWTEYFVYLGDAFLRFLPVTFWFIISLFNRKILSLNSKVFLITWSAMAMFSIMLPGRFFGHYFVQFMLPFSLLAGVFFDSRLSHHRFWKKLLLPKIGYTLLGLLITINIFFQWSDYIKKADEPKIVAEYLEPILDPEDVIYSGDFHMIVYHLLKKQSPTPYIHRSLLTSAENRYAINIDHNEEMIKILDKEPDYIITSKKYSVSNSPLVEALKNEYELIKHFEGTAKIYRRR